MRDELLGSGPEVQANSSAGGQFETSEWRNPTQKSGLPETAASLALHLNLDQGHPGRWRHWDPVFKVANAEKNVCASLSR
jgi:hypothetical protein